MAALKGLAPVSALSKTVDGTAALGANFTVTGAIQTGAIRQPTLMPFAEQQQQALRDAFITDGNLVELTDGLGTTLGAAYRGARALSRPGALHQHLQIRLGCDRLRQLDKRLGFQRRKIFLRQRHHRRQEARFPTRRMAIFKDIDGAPDPFRPRPMADLRGTPGADLYGDSRPFQTEPTTLPIVGPDYFNVPAGNDVYNRGPIMNLTDSPSFPSGHTTYGYMGSLLLAVLVPDRYQEMVARGRGIRQRPHYSWGRTTPWTCWAGEPLRPTISRISSPTIPPT